MIFHDESELSGLSDKVGPLDPPTPEQVADVRAYVARHARDRADLMVLLDATGLGAA